MDWRESSFSVSGFFKWSSWTLPSISSMLSIEAEEKSRCTLVLSFARSTASIPQSAWRSQNHSGLLFPKYIRNIWTPTTAQIATAADSHKLGITFSLRGCLRHAAEALKDAAG